MEPLLLLSLALSSLLFLVLPLVLVLWMTYRPARSRLDLFLKAALLILYAVGLTWEAPWGLFSIYIGRAVPVVLFWTAIRGVRRQYPALPAYAPRPAWGWIKRGVYTLLILSLVADAVKDIQGRFYHEQPLDLAYPLKEGFVGHGGSTENINYHCADTTAQQYALDLERLYPWGGRAKGLFPEDPAAYAIYGDTVFSPCRGRVALVRDGLDNMAIGNMDTVNLAGNSIVLEYRNHLIVFAHLQKHSIRVVPGQEVRAGQPLARVGNSGHTTEPHLHLHAITGSDTARILTGNGIPVTFNGRFLVRNNRICGKDFQRALAAKGALANAYTSVRDGLALADGLLEAVKRWNSQ